MNVYHPKIPLPLAYLMLKYIRFVTDSLVTPTMLSQTGKTVDHVLLDYCFREYHADRSL